MKARVLIIVIISFYTSLCALGQTGQDSDTLNKRTTFVIKAKKPPDLNNKTFAIKLLQTKGKKGQRRWKWDNDEITFKKGRLTSKVMKENENYPAAVYFASIDSSSVSGAIKFKMFSKGPYDSKTSIALEGTITGDHIEGTASWISVMGAYSYTFSGELKH